MAYRADEQKSAHTALLIGLLGKIGFSPKESGRMNMRTREGENER
jgi:hypothetical protein